MKLNEVVDKYIALRDKKAQMNEELKEKLKPIDAAMEQIEAVLLQTFEKLGTDSCKTSGGTAYVSTRTSATVADKEAFKNFIMSDEENWAMADVRAAKKAIEQFVEENQDLPPGINWSEERVINVRRT
ncbi:hypothetical protein [Paraburkholderia unamae]|uniref:Uncharacterized protein n=1 Tax=Paraburkholderia unamae TaxID=219649 RepID=A0ACC6RGJ5_9BURK